MNLNLEFNSWLSMVTGVILGGNEEYGSTAKLDDQSAKPK